jgi:hypothetical protein
VRDYLRDERRRRSEGDVDPIILMRVIHEPVLSPDGNHHLGGRQLDTGASTVIRGWPNRRFWQEEGETTEAFEVRVRRGVPMPALGRIVEGEASLALVGGSAAGTCH